MLHFQEIPLINLPSWEVIPLLPRSKVTRMEFYVEKHGGPKKTQLIQPRKLTYSLNSGVWKTMFLLKW